MYIAAKDRLCKNQNIVSRSKVLPELRPHVATNTLLNTGTPSWRSCVFCVSRLS